MSPLDAIERVKAEVARRRWWKRSDGDPAWRNVDEAELGDFTKYPIWSHEWDEAVLALRRVA